MSVALKVFEKNIADFVSSHTLVTAFIFVGKVNLQEKVKGKVQGSLCQFEIIVDNRIALIIHTPS
jgi:hypothetical protein